MPARAFFPLSTLPFGEKGRWIPRCVSSTPEKSLSQVGIPTMERRERERDREMKEHWNLKKEKEERRDTRGMTGVKALEADCGPTKEMPPRLPRNLFKVLFGEASKPRGALGTHQHPPRAANLFHYRANRRFQNRAEKKMKWKDIDKWARRKR